jgi:hypothetical protein
MPGVVLGESKKEKILNQNFQNVGSVEFRAWRATAEEIREKILDTGVVCMSAGAQNGLLPPSTYMEDILHRVVGKLKTGRFIWAGDLSGFYDDREFVLGLLKESDDYAIPYILDSFIGWCDEKATHIIMSWVVEGKFNLVCMECVFATVERDDIVMKDNRLIAVTAYIQGPGLPAPDVGFLINSHFYDDEDVPEDKLETASDRVALSINLIKLVAWLLQRNDAPMFARVPPQRRGVRRPLPSYTSVVKDGYATVIQALAARREAAQPKGGHHASPVPHDRRGCWVKLKSGKVIWRREAKVRGGAEKARETNAPVRGHYEVRT